MLKLSIIGNLGSDAEIMAENGQKFVRMSIAHTERRKKADGSEYEQTTWVSATINGDGGNVVQYLKKGTRVYAYGDVGLRVFHSEKERRMMAGLNLFIRNIELLGGSSDEVPRDLYDIDGVAHRINKYYHCSTSQLGLLYDRSGHEFLSDEQGWVIPKKQPAESSADGEGLAESTDTEQDGRVVVSPDQAADSDQKPKKSKK